MKKIETSLKAKLSQDKTVCGWILEIVKWSDGVKGFSSTASKIGCRAYIWMARQISAFK
jgi:hypothetical protein